MDKLLGVDVSGYQNPDKVNYSELKAHGFSFVIVKLDQYLTDDHVRLAKSAGLEVGGYYWNDPLSTSAYQSARILSELNRLNLRFAWLDVEQWWSDWDLWYKAITNIIPWSSVPRLTPQKISDNSHQVLNLVKPNLSIPWGVYTGKWVLDQYALPMYGWIDSYQTWLAQYVSKKGSVTWEYLTSLPGNESLIPLGLPRIWQVSGSFVYPGRSLWDCYDTNLFLGNNEAFQSWMGGVQPLPPPLPIVSEYQIIVANLTVRSGPGISYTPLYYIHSPQKITVVEIRGSWGRFDTACWCNITSSYCRKVS